MKLKSIFQQQDDQEDQWISIADMMAGLMIVFLFIAIVNLKDQFDCTSGRTTIFLRYFKKYITAKTASQIGPKITANLISGVIAIIIRIKHTKLMVK